MKNFLTPFTISMGILSVIITFMAKCHAGGTTPILIEDPKIQQVRITLDSGQITIDATEKEGKASASYTPRDYDEQRCEYIRNLANGVLEVSFKKRQGAAGQCKVDLNFSIPKKSDIKIQHGAGDITINNMEGAVDIQSGSGNILGKNLVGNTNVQIGSGAFNASYLLGNRLISLHGGLLDATIELPPQSTVSLKAHALLIKQENDFPNTANPQVTISGQLGSGSIKVKKKN